MPLSAAEIKAGIAKAGVGALIEIEWAWDDNLGRHFEWHASMTEKLQDGSAKIFFAAGQRGMPKLTGGATGLTCEFPYTGVTYFRVLYEQPIDVSMFQLHSAAMEEDAGRKAPEMLFAIHDPTSWAAQIEAGQLGAELIKTRLAVELGASPTMSAQRKRAIDSVIQFVDAAREIEEWWALPAFLALGTQLVRTARETVVYETLHITTAELSKETAKEDHGDDILAAAVAKIAGDRADKNNKKKGQGRYCTTCKRTGHTAPYCRQGNGDGGAVKDPPVRKK